MMGNRVVVLLEGLFWAAACLGTWLLTLSSVSGAELLTATVAAVPCGALAVVVRRVVGGAWAPSPRWARWLLPLPVAVLADTARVLAIAAGVLAGRRIPDGRIRSVELPRERPGTRWRARQVTAVALVTATPGTVVVDVAEDSGRMLLHDLGAGRPALEEVVRR